MRNTTKNRLVESYETSEGYGSEEVSPAKKCKSHKTIDIDLEARFVRGKFVFTNKHEIEKLALDVFGYSENIYFEEIPIGDNIILKYDGDYFFGWVLETLNSDCI